MKAPLIFSSASHSINVSKIFKLVVTKVFGLKTNIEPCSDPRAPTGRILTKKCVCEVGGRTGGGGGGGDCDRLSEFVFPVHRVVYPTHRSVRLSVCLPTGCV
eukprot:EC787269.1.p1 GENE.EC787269.1~~EC787269.1.p1  ORF type:complete len:102 (+),score=15.86 EC787269.1:175-480(+)